MKFGVCKIVNSVQLRRAQYIARLHDLTPRHFIGFFDNRIKWRPVLNEFGAMINTDGTTKKYKERPLKKFPESMEFGNYLFNKPHLSVDDDDEEGTIIEDAVDTSTWEYEPPSTIQLPLIFWDNVLSYGGVYLTLFVTTEHVFHVVDNEDIYTYIWLPRKRKPVELQLTGSIIKYHNYPFSLEMTGQERHIYTVEYYSDEGNYYLNYVLTGVILDFITVHKYKPKRGDPPVVLKNELLSVRRQQPDEIIPVPMWKAS